MFQGLRSTVYKVSDLNRAKEWYSAVLGQAPYFDEPFYVGFNAGGYELGLLPGESAGVTTYWGVPNADDAYARLLAMGAVEHEPVQDVGEGIRLGAVLDPLGNVLGIIENPHFAAAAINIELTESSESCYSVTLSVTLTDFQYQYQVREAARSIGLNEADYMKECLIFGIEKGR